MNAIALKVTGTPATNVQDMALRIAREAPTLADLNSDQLEQIARMVMAQRLTQELNTAATLAGIDYSNEKETFLNNAGTTDSKHTRRGYSSALARLEAYAERAKISPLELTPARADDFIYSMKGEASPSTIRGNVAACSSGCSNFLWGLCSKKDTFNASPKTTFHFGPQSKHCLCT